jgi:hypothetical protein
MKKSIRITLESERLLVITTRRTCVEPCAACGDEMRMVTVEEAATLARVSARSIYRAVEAGTLHFLETTEGPLLICLTSLNESLTNPKALSGTSEV